MTTPFRASISRWHYYVEAVNVECDICYESAEIWEADRTDADDTARYNEWYVDIDVKNDKLYEHLCYSCAEELHFCAWCEERVWCDDAVHCDDAYCDVDCLDHVHQEWGERNPNDVECSECEWENPFAISDAPLVGAWQL